VAKRWDVSSNEPQGRLGCETPSQGRCSSGTIVAGPTRACVRQTSWRPSLWRCDMIDLKRLVYVENVQVHGSGPFNQQDCSRVNKEGIRGHISNEMGVELNHPNLQ
jgi:hypothetical protein